MAQKPEKYFNVAVTKTDLKRPTVVTLPNSLVVETYLQDYNKCTSSPSSEVGSLGLDQFEKEKPEDL